MNNVDIASEKEDGEIVDLSDFENNNDFEDISSEEEFELRERIAELESRNLELEQIASISGKSLVQYGDISKKGSLASYGKYHQNQIRHIKSTSKPRSTYSQGRRYLQSKRTRLSSRNSTLLNNSSSYRRSRRRRRKSSTAESKLKRITKRNKKQRRKKYSSSDESDVPYSREELAAATRHPKTKNLFANNKIINFNEDDEIKTISSDEDDTIKKLRLEALKTKPEVKSFLLEPDTQNEVLHINNNDTKTRSRKENSSKRSAEEITLEEQELRLIALKSAYVKKNEARKKRKLMNSTEPNRPYSPTDDVIIQTVEIPIINLVEETDYSDNNMDISPINSPHPHCEAENNPIDMDLALSGNSNSPVSFVEQLFADDPFLNWSSPSNKNYIRLETSIDNIIDEMSPSKPSPKKVEHIQEETQPLPTIIDKTDITNILISPVKSNIEENIDSKVLNDKPPEDHSMDVSLEEDCLRSLLLSNLNKKSKKQTIENTVPSPIIKSPSHTKEPSSSVIEIPLQLNGMLKNHEISSGISKPSDSNDNKVSKLTEPIDIIVNKPKEKKQTVVQPKKILNQNNSTLLSNRQNVKSVNEIKSIPLPVTNDSSKPIQYESKSVPKLIIRLGVSSESSEDEISQKNKSNGKENDENVVLTTPSPKNKSNFEFKLEAFLKNVRSKVEQQSNSPPKKVVMNSKKIVNAKKVVSNGKPPVIASTPVAVRHLPASSQLEYKRLISRMKLLEKQKLERLASKINISADHISVTVQNDNMIDEKTINSSEAFPDTGNIVVKIDEHNNKQVINSINPIINSKVISILKKAENNKNTINELVKNSKTKELSENEKLLKSLVDMENEEKLNVLQKVETDYSEHTVIFLNELSSLVDLIKFARNEKTKKLTLESDMNDLKEKLKKMEIELDENKKALSNLYPKILTSHKKIIDSRKKCATYDEFCLKVGKIIKGEEYKIPVNNKTVIVEQLKTISNESKKLKTLNINNVRNMIVESTMENEPNIIEEETETNNLGGSSSIAQQYKSPLEFMKATKVNLPNPNGVMCPFELNGKCEDSTCKYEHFPVKI